MRTYPYHIFLRWSKFNRLSCNLRSILRKTKLKFTNTKNFKHGKHIAIRYNTILPQQPQSRFDKGVKVAKQKINPTNSMQIDISPHAKATKASKNHPQPQNAALVNKRKP